MLRTNSGKNRNAVAGSAQVEFAILAPLMLLMMLGAIDFGRVYYHGVTVANAASVGAFYGSQNNIKSVHDSGIQTAALNDAQDLKGDPVTATPSHFCTCPSTDGSSQTVVDCFGGPCVDYGMPRLYVRAQVTQTFRTVVRYPGVPDPVNVQRIATMRVQ
jgi:Flp pilus assembly protein TadG